MSLGLGLQLWSLQRVGGGPEAPHLDALDTDVVDIAGGDVVTISGTSLGDATACTVGGTPATRESQSDTELTFTVPEISAGSHAVVVTGPGGESNALTIEARDRAVHFGGSQSYKGAVGSGAVSVARVRFRLDAMPDTANRIIAGSNPGNRADGWLVWTSKYATGFDAVGVLVVYAAFGGSLQMLTRKFLMPADVGRVFVLHVVADGTDVRVYLDGFLLDVPKPAAGITPSAAPMLVGGRADGTVSSNNLTVLDVAEGTTPIDAAAVAADAASPEPSFVGQSHRYVATAGVGATWHDEVGTADLTPFGAPTIVSPRSKLARHRGCVEVWGDSIAAGRAPGPTLDGGWRRPVQRSLSERGIAITYRGYAGTVAPATDLDFDFLNSATGGEDLNTRLATLATLLPQRAPNDAATVIAYGINDIIVKNRTATQLAADIATAVGYVDAARPGRPVFVCNVLRVSSGSATAPQHAEIADFQAGFVAMITSIQSSYPQVVGIDYASAVSDPDDSSVLYDGVHPTTATYAAMADVIAPILGNVITVT